MKYTSCLAPDIISCFVESSPIGYQKSICLFLSNLYSINNTWAAASIDY